MLPFSYPQIQRIYQAATDKPSERGEFFELPDELLGFAGFRAVKLDPIKSMGFKLAEYQKGIREARKLFTGGEEGLLRGGPKTPEQLVDRFIQANKGRFLVQQKMRKDLLAAETLGANDLDIRKEFVDRQLSNDYIRLLRGKFAPYEISDNIRKQFDEIENTIGEPNPYKESFSTLRDIIMDLRSLSLDDNFDEIIDFNFYRQLLPGVEGEPLSQVPPLPPQPMPSPSCRSSTSNRRTTIYDISRIDTDRISIIITGRTTNEITTKRTSIM
jgi:hypothetical protein